jgi:colanic acid/amylovoran biosynthesis glycosyltransferase
LRVAVWVKVFPPRYESFIVNQIEGLLARGHEVHVVANRKGDHWHLVSQQMQEQLKGRIHYQPSVPPRRMQRWVGAAAMSVASAVTRPSSVGALLGVVTRSARLGNTDLLFKMLPFLKQQPFDVVHCQYAPLGVTAVALKSWGALRGRIVTSCRGHDLSQLETGARSSYQQLFKQGDFFLPVCDHFRQRLVNLGCPTAKLAVHRSGIDCTRLREVSRRTSKTDLAPQLITVGRLVEKKGVEYGIRAVARLTKRIPHLHYTVIGTPGNAARCGRQR